jgi:hypothetical protein
MTNTYSKLLKYFFSSIKVYILSDPDFENWPRVTFVPMNVYA